MRRPPPAPRAGGQRGCSRTDPRPPSRRPGARRRGQPSFIRQQRSFPSTTRELWPPPHASSQAPGTPSEVSRPHRPQGPAHSSCPNPASPPPARRGPHRTHGHPLAAATLPEVRLRRGGGSAYAEAGRHHNSSGSSVSRPASGRKGARLPWVSGVFWGGGLCEEGSQL